MHVRCGWTKGIHPTPIGPSYESMTLNVLNLYNSCVFSVVASFLAASRVVASFSTASRSRKLSRSWVSPGHHTHRDGILCTILRTSSGHPPDILRTSSGHPRTSPGHREAAKKLAAIQGNGGPHWQLHTLRRDTLHLLLTSSGNPWFIPVNHQYLMRF